jgi:hypothetical protein
MPVDTMQAYRRVEVLELGTGWRQVASHCGCFILRQEPKVPAKVEAGWHPEPFWNLWRT